MAELNARCEARGGALVAGATRATEGYRCADATMNGARAYAEAGRSRSGAEANTAFDQSLRNN